MDKVNSERLEEIVPLFYHSKLEGESYIKIADDYKDEIKKIMRFENIFHYAIQDLNITITEKSKKAAVEEQLIKKIKDLNIPNIIKTKEYVDMDALESAVYHGIINTDDISDCFTENKSIALTVNKKGKK